MITTQSHIRIPVPVPLDRTGALNMRDLRHRRWVIYGLGRVYVSVIGPSRAIIKSKADITGHPIWTLLKLSPKEDTVLPSPQTPLDDEVCSSRFLRDESANSGSNSNGIS